MAETKKKTKEVTFEEKMNRLDLIIEKMNSSVLSLEETISLYEEAQKLIKELDSQLKEAKEKITK